jgi:large subunit ribosomal protein L31
MRVSICANCHPFYTGSQRQIVDTEGQVDRFMKRLAATQERQADSARRKQSKGEKPKKKSLFEEIYGEEAQTEQEEQPASGEPEQKS